MKRIKIESTRVKSAGYDPINKILELEFMTNGAIYHYFNVPIEEYNKFKNAESKGKYVQILTKKYKYKLIP